MDNHTIARVLRSNHITQPYFGGVFSSDEIPWQDKKNLRCKRFYIFNLDTSEEKGSHWVCIMLSPFKSKNFYFDSYGFPPIYVEFEKFMDHCYKFNSKALQHNLSTSCGQWCLYFVYHMCFNFPFHLIHSKFNRGNKLKNDYMLNSVVKTCLLYTSDAADD